LIYLSAESLGWQHNQSVVSGSKHQS